MKVKAELQKMIDDARKHILTRRGVWGVWGRHENWHCLSEHLETIKTFKCSVV